MEEGGEVGMGWRRVVVGGGGDVGGWGWWGRDMIRRWDGKSEGVGCGRMDVGGWMWQVSN